MTLAELRQAVAALPPGTSLTVSVDELREALNGNLPTHGEIQAAPNGLLTATQVAERLGTSQRWVYDHGDQLGAKRLSRRCVRFPEDAVARYLARRR